MRTKVTDLAIDEGAKGHDDMVEFHSNQLTLPQAANLHIVGGGAHGEVQKQ